MKNSNNQNSVITPFVHSTKVKSSRYLSISIALILHLIILTSYTQNELPGISNVDDSIDRKRISLGFSAPKIHKLVYDSIKIMKKNSLGYPNMSLYGLQNKNGQMILPCTFTQIIENYDNSTYLLLNFEENNGLCDSNGYILIPLSYSRLKNMDKDHWLAEDQSENYYLFKIKGKVASVVDNGHYEYRTISQGTGNSKNYRQVKAVYDFANRKQSFDVSPKTTFHKEFAINEAKDSLIYSDDKFFFLGDTKGKPLWKNSYESLKSLGFTKHFFVILKGQRFIIDKDEHILSNFSNLENASLEGCLIPYQTSSGKWNALCIYAKEIGKLLLFEKLDIRPVFNLDYYLIKTNGKYQFYEITNYPKVIIEPISAQHYDSVYYWNKSKISIGRIGNGWEVFYRDKLLPINGVKNVYQLNFMENDIVLSLDNESLVLLRTDYMSTKNVEGIVRLPYSYIESSSTFKNKYIVGRNNKLGAVMLIGKESYKEIISCNYDQLFQSGNENYIGCKAGLWYLLKFDKGTNTYSEIYQKPVTITKKGY
jgi:hypothetical protein